MAGATSSGPSPSQTWSVPSEASRRWLFTCDVSAAPPLHLPLHLPCISPCTSPAPPLHLPCISPQVVVTFDIDANGILSVTAVDKKTGARGSITITSTNARNSKDDVARMVAEAEK